MSANEQRPRPNDERPGKMRVTENRAVPELTDDELDRVSGGSTVARNQEGSLGFSSGADGSSAAPFLPTGKRQHRPLTLTLDTD